VPAIKEILKEIELIRKGITKKELLFAQSSLIRKFPSNFESYRQIAANIVGQIIHSLPKEYFKNYVDEINKVTPERILKAAKANLHPDKLTTVVVGKRKNILNGLKEIYPGDIFELDINGAVLNKL
jgi:predicted Zn-dependent peptidase